MKRSSAPYRLDQAVNHAANSSWRILSRLALASAFAVVVSAHAAPPERKAPLRESVAERSAVRGEAGQVLLERIEASRTWKDVRLSETAQSRLRALAAQSRTEAGLAMLLSGAEQPARVRAAEALATELRRPLLRVDLSVVVGKYIGETEKNLRRVFEAAEASDAILLFDEADALFGKRTDVKDAHDKYANQEVSYLLERVERFHGLVLVTTNQPAQLDPELLKRYRRVVEFVPAGGEK